MSQDTNRCCSFKGQLPTEVKWIDRFIRAFLYLLIFWLPFGKAVIESCVIAAALLWFCKRLLIFLHHVSPESTFRKKISCLFLSFRPTTTYLNGPILAFLVFCFISSWGSVLALKSLHAFFTKALEWFAIFLLVVEFLSRRKDIMTALNLFLVAGFFVCLDAVVQYHWLGHDIIFQHGLSRHGATASFTHANTLGGYLTFLIPLGLGYVYAFGKTAEKRWGLVVFSGLGLWTALITLSRGAWVGLAGGLVFLVWKCQSKLWGKVIGIVMVLTIVFWVAAPAQLKQQLRLDSESLLGSFQWRDSLWADAMTMISDRPLFGHGLNLFMDVFQEYRTKHEGLFYYDPSYAHNCYLQMAGEIGILGFSCFAWMMIRLFRRNQAIETVSPQTEERELRFVLVGLLSGCLAFLIHSFFDVNFYSLQLVALFWFMIGAIVSLDNMLNISTNYDKNV